MKIFELSIGAEDYGNRHVARLSILDVSIALGHSNRYWLEIEFDADWWSGFYFRHTAWPKRIPGESFIAMLVRRFAPGWVAR